MSVPAGGEATVYLTITTGIPAFCTAEAACVAAMGPEVARAKTQQRWAGWVAAVLKNRTPKPETTFEANIQWSAVKALQTLVNNWRFVPGSENSGILPSYTKYDTGYWSWDTYKQAVACAIFSPDLARAQLRLIVAARDVVTGHITDLVDRCGAGTGCPGKPNLLSWATWEVFNRTGDKAFVAEMYPAIEGARAVLLRLLGFLLFVFLCSLFHPASDFGNALYTLQRFITTCTATVTLREWD